MLPFVCDKFVNMFLSEEKNYKPGFVNNVL